MLSVPQAAQLLGIGATFAWELVHEGTIPSIKLGRRVLVPRRHLEQIIVAEAKTQGDQREYNKEA